MTDMIHISQLTYAADDINSRKTNKTERIDELAASINSHGLLHPLLVRRVSEDTFEVVDGNRRLAALNQLDHEGPVACIEMQGSDAEFADVSLAANITAVPIDPIDAYEAFATLVEKGMKIEDIAHHYGVTENTVRRRMMLGDVLPEVRQAVRDGDLQLQHMKLFAKQDRPKQQDAWDRLQNETLHTWELNRFFTAGTMPADCTVAQVVGEEAYLKAGGTIDIDLFNEDAATWLDANIADDIYRKKAAKIAQKELQDGQQLHYEIDGYQPEGLENGYLRPVHEGETSDWLVIKGDLSVSHETFVSYSAKPAPKQDEEEDGPKPYSNALVQDLKDAAHTALLNELYHHPDLVDELIMLSHVHRVAGNGYDGVMSMPETHNFIIVEEELKVLRKIIAPKKIHTQLRKMNELLTPVLEVKLKMGALKNHGTKNPVFELVDVDISTAFVRDATFFQRLNKEQLLAVAEECNIDLQGATKKAEIVTRLADHTPIDWVPEILVPFRKDDLKSAA